MAPRIFAAEADDDGSPRLRSFDGKGSGRQSPVARVDIRLEEHNLFRGLNPRERAVGVQRLSRRLGQEMGQEAPQTPAELSLPE
jgi:hypothetical protein